MGQSVPHSACEAGLLMRRLQKRLHAPVFEDVYGGYSPTNEGEKFCLSLVQLLKKCPSKCRTNFEQLELLAFPKIECVRFSLTHLSVFDSLTDRSVIFAARSLNLFHVGESRQCSGAFDFLVQQQSC